MTSADDIRDAVIAEARTWLNTPFGHQQAVKGLMVDCTNFIAETALASAVMNDVGFVKDYRRRETGEKMVELLCGYCYMVFEPRKTDLERVRRADVLALCDEGLQQPNRLRHLILVTQIERYLKGIHASGHGVREHRLDLKFQRRVHSVWRLPKLVEADGDSAWAFGTKVLFDLREAAPAPIG